MMAAALGVQNQDLKLWIQKMTNLRAGLEWHKVVKLFCDFDQQY
jgi:hypothetical protein